MQSVFSNPAGSVKPVAAAPHPLQSRVFRIGDLGTTGKSAATGIRTGFRLLDNALHGGGWTRPGLTEILCNHVGVGELSLVLKGLGSHTAQPSVMHIGETTHLLWVTTQVDACIPYAPALAQSGLSLSHLAIVRARDNDEALWAAEQGLKSGACRAVLMRINDRHCSTLSLRRLMQAAIAGNSAALVLRPLESAATPSPAATRLALHPEKAGLLRIELLKQRGLPPGKALFISTRNMECLDREPVAVRTKTKAQVTAEEAKAAWLEDVLSGPVSSSEVQVRLRQPDANRR